ncbi:MAG: type II secretion system F family protein [Acidobacteriota bacterium]
MAEFICKLGTPTGQIVVRTCTAASETDLRRDFDSKDYMVFSIKKKALAASLLNFSSMKRKRVSMKEFLVFNQEFASLISAGLPIVASLNILLERRKNLAFKEALIDIRNQVKTGTAISEAFASHGDLFPRLYAPSLASGERSGEIASVLKRYIAYVRTVLAMRQKITSALTYPIILVVVSLGLITLLVTFVLPKFEGFFTDLGAEMPLITRVVIGVSGWVTAHMYIIIPAVVFSTVAFAVYKRTEAGASLWDRLKMKLPIWGSIGRKYGISNFCRTLSTLVRGGIPLVSSIEISARAIANRVFSSAMLKVARQVREGKSLWESIESTGLMTDMALEMIKVGESTGSLEEMLTNISDFYDEEIEADLARIVSLLEPVLLIFMGLIVATIIMAFYLPLISSFATTSS